MEQTKGLIFDLDGTLADTLPLCLISFQDAVEKTSKSRPTKEEVEKFWGYSEIGIVKNLCPQNWEICFTEFLNIYKQNHSMCCELFEGMSDILDMLENNSIKMALVTGKGIDSCSITLSEFGIKKYFEHIEMGAETGSIKPECIERVLGKWGMSSSEVYYVGDSVNDIKDAREAGVKSIAAAWAETANIELLEQEFPDLIFYTIEEFADWLNAGLGKNPTA